MLQVHFREIGRLIALSWLGNSAGLCLLWRKDPHVTSVVGDSAIVESGGGRASDRPSRQSTTRVYRGDGRGIGLIYPIVWPNRWP